MIHLNNEIFKLRKRLEKDNFIIVTDGKLARQLSKKPFIKKLRNKEQLVIGWDRSKKETIFFKKPKL